MTAPTLPPWVYHVEWPLELSGPELKIAGTARLRVVISPRAEGCGSRDDLNAQVLGMLELPPWTPPQGAPIDDGTCTLRWLDGGWHLEARLPALAEGRRLEFIITASPGQTSAATPEPAQLCLRVDGIPLAHGELRVFLRKFGLVALGETLPPPVDDRSAWRERLPRIWPWT